ncbi:MAG: BatA domain-containing protein, partial [Alphaproteobacteria bacterium]|nr:BatA domain-containing protein [Alphaproteobacteria bacterium]
MLSLGALAFASPWLLVGLAALPILWWLLRVTPPVPRRLRFPAIRLLFGLVPRDETPARTPLWLILLRMVLAGLVILALAHPLLNPSTELTERGPLVLVIDNDWAAAHDWAARQRIMGELLEQAGREDRQVVLLDTAPPSGEEAARPASLQRAADARAAAEALAPRPWPPDRIAAAARLDGLSIGNANIVWLSDGIDGGNSFEFAERLQHLGSLRIVTDPPSALASFIGPAQHESGDLAVAVHRAAADGPAEYVVRASGEDGRLLARETLRLMPGQAAADLALAMPSELRNQAVRADIEGQPSAGAVLLLDDRWRRRPVGIVSASPGEAAQPLLTGTFYLERALSPFSEVRRGSVAELLRRDIAMVVFADSVPASRAEHDQIVKWMQAGGVLVRFAGPDLAAKSTDDLLPVTLRRGGRTIGGTLSWEQPAHLAAFAPESPFAGLAIPDDVTVSRQVLAEPSLDLAGKTWARLTDGTPLVTGERRGQGWLVLVHTTGNPAWSNLSLSGLFVEMLRRTLALSQGVGGAGDVPLPA